MKEMKKYYSPEVEMKIMNSLMGLLAGSGNVQVDNYPEDLSIDMTIEKY